MSKLIISPSRQTAIHILDNIVDKLGEGTMETIFDCKDGNTIWYDLEDMITNLIEEIRAKDKEKITRRNRQIKALKEQIEQLKSDLEDCSARIEL